jgi:hypothetical protein
MTMELTIEKKTAAILKRAAAIACKAQLPLAVDPSTARGFKLPKRQVNKSTILMEACPVQLAGGKTIIHVNQHHIKANAKNGTRKAVLSVKRGKSNTYGNQVVIRGADGQEAARVVYSPDKPLSCGARVWIETKGKVTPLKR